MNNCTVEELERLLIKDNRPYEEVGRMYNITGNGIKKRALRLGITLKPRRGINNDETFNKGLSKTKLNSCLLCNKEYKLGSDRSKIYCSHKCQQRHRHIIAYNKIITGDATIMRANYSPAPFRNDILKEQENRCSICSIIPEWNKKTLVFIVDHIDGNASNNKRDNLRCICPNCDSQLDTYKSKNKNGARSYYRYKTQG